MIVLIPAYEPDHKLAQLVDSLCTAPGDHRVLVVNDGSDPRFEEIFDEVRGSGATVIEHHPNRGKGHALKRGFAYISEHFPSQDVVCADSDGQHTVSDIFAIAAELRSTQNGIVLGARGFTGDIPLRSRFGNSATRMALRAASGLQQGCAPTPPHYFGGSARSRVTVSNTNSTCCSKQNATTSQ